MEREEFLIALSLLLVLEGYLEDNLAPALLGFGIAVYLLMVRLNVDFSVMGNRVLKENRLEEGKEGKVELTLENKGKEVFVRIIEPTKDFDVLGTLSFPLKEGETQKVSYALKPKQKGEFTLKPAKVLVEDVRGLYFEEFEIGKEEKVYVYPSLESIKEAARADYNIRLAEFYKRSRFFGSESVEIKDLREYRQGDDFRRVDWKASLRLGELIVREMLKESEADVYIFIDNTNEMRKGIRKAKIDYASTLALQLASNLIKSYRVGLVIYDEERAEFVKASKSTAQLEVMRRKLNLRWKKGAMSLKFKLSVRMSQKAKSFIGTVLPLKKGRRGSKGIFEGLSLIKQPSLLIFISDLSNPSDLYRAIARAKRNHKVLLLSPNPVLFYRGKLDRETLKRLYRAYLERESLLRKFNTLVPTIDLGPSDYIREIAKVV